MIARKDKQQWSNLLDGGDYGDDGDGEHGDDGEHDGGGFGDNFLLACSCSTTHDNKATVINYVGVGNNDGDDFDQDALLCSFIMANGQNSISRVNVSLERLSARWQQLRASLIPSLLARPSPPPPPPPPPPLPPPPRVTRREMRRGNSRR